MALILILDDRGTNRKILAQLAKSVEPGAEVVTFGCPVETLEWLEGHEPDLIITDYRMPQLDGAELTGRIRKKLAGGDAPIVVVTAYNDPLLRRRALEAGATDFLVSPVDHVEFRTRVRNLLALRRHQVRLREEARGLARELAASERSRLALIQESRKALVQLIDTIPALVSATDREGRVVFVNARQAAQAGAPPADLAGRGAARLFGDGRAAQSLSADAEVFASGQTLPAFEEEVVQDLGDRRTLLTTKAPLFDAQDRVSAVLTTSLDITDRKRAEERLLYLARHDPLTGLANRNLLGDRLEEGCGQAGDPFALLFLDVDRFKAVNDVLGHQAGDRLLRDIAARLGEALREDDLACRLGGDEFAIVRSGAGAEEAAELALRLIGALERPFQVMGQGVSVSASVGITLFPADARRADELLCNADLAMYRAKANGRNGYCFFDPTMDHAAREAMRLERELRAALAEGQLELFWQPQLSLACGRIVGAEALLRWHHPERGLLSPGVFLPMAEETGLIAPITRWALGAACRQGAAWAGERGGKGARVSINISPSMFRTADVAALVREALAESGCPPRLLDLEVTESAQLDDVEGIAAALAELRALGVRLSIDDFGSGYSSLAHARRFPVHRLKIDRGFTANFLTDLADAAIVGAVVALGHKLGMEVVAEGVETEAQLDALRELGCDEVQGYLIGRPAPVAEAERLLRAPAPPVAAARAPLG